MVSNAFVTVLTMYALLMSAAMGVLFWAFRGGFNLSGRLFLLSEFLRLPTVATVGAVHLYPELGPQPAFFIGNLFFLASEVTFACSLYVLPRDSGARALPPLLIGTALFVGACELIRAHHQFLTFQLYSIAYAAVSFTSVWICAHAPDDRLRSAAFWRVLRYIETIFLILWLTRFVVQLNGVPFTPMLGGSSNFILLAAMITLLMFRYVSYQSIWMTWAAPGAKENRLNKALLNSLRERDELLQRLATANRRVGISTLASSLAHQLSQPLTGAALQAEALKRNLMGGRSDTDTIQGIEKVSTSLQNLSSLVRSLRSLFATNNDALKQHSFSAVCAEAITLVKVSEKARRVSFRVMDDAPAEILCNAVQLQQVIINVLENAIDASIATGQADPVIDIVLSEDSDLVSFTARDYGRGFSDELLANPFDLYRTTKPQGTGIGLWLCRQIIEKHRGNIVMYNHLQGGACVRVDLPAVRILP